MHFEALGSPVYARLAGRLALDPGPARPFFGEPPDFHDPLRLFGAVHYLVLTGAAPDALSGDAGRLRGGPRRARGRDPPAHPAGRRPDERGAALRGAASRVPHRGARDRASRRAARARPERGAQSPRRPLPLRYAEGAWGGSDALLELVADERGRPVPAELLATSLDVRRRRGIDLAPVDATSEEGYLLLRSFIWPGLEDRVRRLDAAVATLRAEPERPQLIQGDYVERLPECSQSAPRMRSRSCFRRPRRATCPRMRPRGSGRRSTRPASDGRPLAWVSTRRHDEREGAVEDAYELELRVWPGPPRLAAHLDFHGNWLEWLLP